MRSAPGGGATPAPSRHHPVDRLSDSLDRRDDDAEVVHRVGERGNIVAQRRELMQPRQQTFIRTAPRTGHRSSTSRACRRDRGGTAASDRCRTRTRSPTTPRDRSHVRQHVGVDHAAATELEPRPVGALDIELGRRLGEREVRRSQAARELRPEVRLGERLDRAGEIAERDAAIDDESLDLMEHGHVRGVGGVPPEDAARTTV